MLGISDMKTQTFRYNLRMTTFFSKSAALHKSSGHLTYSDCVEFGGGDMGAVDHTTYEQRRLHYVKSGSLPEAALVCSVLNYGCVC